MEPDALGSLIDRHAAALTLYARQFCACPEDVVQTAWFTVSDDPAGLDATTAAEALATPPLELREILVARLWGNLTFEDIAATVGASAATCHRRYTEGLTQLRARLGVKPEPEGKS